MFTCHLVVAPLSLCLVHLQILDILTASMETTITWEITVLIIGEITPKDIILINMRNHTDLHKNLKTNDSFMIPV